MNDPLKLTYQALRSRGRKAGRALEQAKAEIAAGRQLYGRPSGAGLGAPMDDGGRWAEYPESLGLRWFGWADEIGGRYGSRVCDHKGWFLAPDGWTGETARGCVYILPSRDGRTQYVPAFRTGSDGRSGWQDMSGEDSAVVYLRDIELGEHGGAESANPSGMAAEQAAYDAARYADGRAERYAEREREYQEAYMAGQDAAGALEEARQARQSFLRLVRDMRADGRPSAESICEALRDKLLALADSWRDGKRKAAELAEQWCGSEPFAEGMAA